VDREYLQEICLVIPYFMGATQGTQAGLEEVIRWTSKGKIKAIIGTVYHFEDMVMGHIKMMESQLFGKLVTTPQKL
jgi:alcohol dehydrogenase